MAEYQLEGNGAQRLLTLFGMRGGPKPVQFVLGTIVSPMPNIAVRLDGDTIDTPEEGIVVSESLTDHTRSISFTGDVSGSVTGANSGTLQNLQITKKDVTIHSNLKPGDRVICGVGNNGQTIFILDKAVI